MDKTILLTVDGTSDGRYQNSAYALLFKTVDEAEQYVESDFITNVVNANSDREMTADEISAEIEKCCEWYGDPDTDPYATAQFRCGDAIVDYKIEKVGIPS